VWRYTRIIQRKIMSEKRVFGPVSEKQRLILTDITTDVILVGGGAGGGKSAVCLLKNLDGISDPNFRCTIFRRTAPELKRQGGLIDESRNIYSALGGEYKSQAMIWRFKSGASIAFSAIAGDDDLGSWQGSQLVRALIDEAADKWTEKQVLFLLSRLRSAHSRIYPQLIMTCNPDINSFLKKWVEYSLGDDGVPLPGTENKIRWFATMENQVYWADSPEECFELHGKPRNMIYARGISEAEIKAMTPEEHKRLFIPKSFRFIPTGVMDNPYLLPPKNTSYLANLLSQPYVNQLKFLHGSWTAKEAGSGYFRREWVQYVDHAPIAVTGRIRSYDFAASEESQSNRDPDWTAGVKMSRGKDGCLYIEHVRRYRKLTDAVLRDVVETGRNDGTDIPISIPKDPGGGGAAANMFFVKYLSEAGFMVKSVKMTGHGSKVQRALPFFAMAEAGLVKVVRDTEDDRWIENMLLELEYFTGGRAEKNDQVDAIADAATLLMRENSLPHFSVPDFTGASPIPKLQ
jgi:predicted phage terminase large subunit-like protein